MSKVCKTDRKFQITETRVERPRLQLLAQCCQSHRATFHILEFHEGLDFVAVIWRQILTNRSRKSTSAPIERGHLQSTAEVVALRGQFFAVALHMT